MTLFWRLDANFQPDPADKTEIDVKFTREADGSTQVELLHHKFETLGEEPLLGLALLALGDVPGDRDNTGDAVEGDALKQDFLPELAAESVAVLPLEALGPFAGGLLHDAKHVAGGVGRLDPEIEALEVLERGESV